MHKRIALLVAAVLAAALAAVLYVRAAYVQLNGEYVRRDTTQLDLSGAPLTDLEVLSQLEQLQVLDLRDTGLTLEAYEQLQSNLPDCQILWQVPFQNGFLELDTQEVTLSSIAEQDREALKYLKNLQTIDARGCEDWEQLLQLQQHYPQCLVKYTVPIGPVVLDQDAETAEIPDADPEEVMEKLRFLPRLKSVCFTGVIPDNEAIYEMKLAYPEVEFLWQFTLCGVEVSSGDAQIDLSGIPMDSVAQVEESLRYFNHLEKVIMCDCGISSEDMDALWKRNPEVRFVWSIQIDDNQIRTDETTFMPYKLGYLGSNVEGEKLRDSQCTELKYLVDIVCMDMGHMAVQDISFVSYMPNLEYLLLGDNRITDISPLAGLQKLKHVELFVNHITDVSPLAQCPALEDVNLCYNEVTDIAPLLEMESLKNLWIAGRYLTEEQIQQLQDAHPEAKIVTDAYRSTGKGWRDLPNYFAQRDLLGMWYMTTDD